MFERGRRQLLGGGLDGGTAAAGVRGLTRKSNARNHAAGWEPLHERDDEIPATIFRKVGHEGRTSPPPDAFQAVHGIESTNGQTRKY